MRHIYSQLFLHRLVLIFFLFVLVSIDSICAEEKNSSSSKVKIWMLEWRGETDAEKGFKDVLLKSDKKFELVELDFKQKTDDLVNLLREDFLAKAEKFDYVYTYGSTITARVKNAIPNNNIRHIATIVTDPIALALTTDLKSSGINKIVAKHVVDLETQIINASKLIKIKKLGFIFNPKEINSNFVRENMQKIAEKHGLTLVDIPVRPDVEGLNIAISAIKNKQYIIDSLYLPPDTFLTVNMDIITATVTKELKIPVIAAIEDQLKKGALLGTVSSYKVIGEALAKEVLKDIEQNNKKRDVPVILDPNPEFKINEQIIKILGINVPGELQKHLKDYK
ncbi:MAG: hypothetical protein HQK49_18215 [Oligoflexia bacterium]|nr:hypothetical protein [Oligoflexia bacterium]